MDLLKLWKNVLSLNSFLFTKFMKNKKGLGMAEEKFAGAQKWKCGINVTKTTSGVTFPLFSLKFKYSLGHYRFCGHGKELKTFLNIIKYTSKIYICAV